MGFLECKVKCEFVWIIKLYVEFIFIRIFLECIGFDFCNLLWFDDKICFFYKYM